MKNLILITSALASNFASFAQPDSLNNDTAPLKKNVLVKDTTTTCPAQFGFFYPLGSNGVQSPTIENNFSVNALFGVNGGVDGAEIGGLVNVNRGKVDGIQIGGIANITSGYTNGTAIAGIINMTSDSANGLIIAGISNVVGDKSNGFHIAGISNTTNGDFMGGQVGGITNLNNGRVDGFQIAGIMNVSNGDLNGIQIGGIANIVHGTTNGSQIGFINASKKVNGLQLGFINFSGESENVVPIGFLSLVKKGYHAFEISTSEVLYTNLALKLGVEKFYNSFRTGIGREGNDSYLSYGYGIGSLISFNEKNKLGIELSSNSIVSEFNNWDLDMLNRLELTYQRFIGKHLTVFGGTALNVYVTEKIVNGEYGTIHIPYTLYTEDWSSGNVSIWAGLHAGVAVRF